MKSSLRLLILAAPLLAAPAIAQTPVGTSFTYQGRLDSTGAPANGTHDFQFRLFNAAVDGLQLGSMLCADNVPVVDGLFSLELDFGDQFTGDARWLEIRVRADITPGNCAVGGYTTLWPRQPLVAAPYALYALNAGQWKSSGSAIVNNNSGFVGINRDYTVGLEWFGVHAPVDSGYGGMYVTTEGPTAWPFYGLRAGTQAAWTYLDGATGHWHLNVAGNRLTATNTGNVGIGTTSPSHRLHVVSSLAGRTIFGSNTAATGDAYGGFFSSSSSVGVGARGTSPNIGLEGQATGAGGIGVYGQGPTRGVFGNSTSANSMAGEFIASGNNGRGVYGAANTGNFSYGVYGEILDPNSAGIGVYGKAPSYGVTGEATNNGVGVIGRALTGLGVYGESGVAGGTGVMGGNTSASGVTYGVHGSVASPAGYAGHFAGRGYFSGNLGLGTLNPANPLSVVGDTDISGRVSIGITGADARLLVRGAAGEDAFRVRVDDGSKLVVKANGGVGIGGNFDVTAVPANGMRIAGAVGIGANPGAFTLVCNGDAAKPGGGSWSNFSDARLKQDIEPIAPGILDRMLELNGTTFEYVPEAIENRLALPGRQIGLIAQNVQAVFPEWVAADEDGFLYVTERGVTAIVVEALRELRAEKDAAIAALQADNDDLRRRLDQMESILARLVEQSTSTN